MRMTMQVLLAIPDADLRLALQLYLGEEPGVFLVAATAGAAGALALLGTLEPDLLIMSWDFSGHERERLLEEAQNGKNPTSVIVLCANDAAQAEALGMGALSVVSTWDPPTCLSDAVRQVRTMQQVRRIRMAFDGDARAV